MPRQACVDPLQLFRVGLQTSALQRLPLLVVAMLPNGHPPIPATRSE